MRLVALVPFTTEWFNEFVSPSLPSRNSTTRQTRSSSNGTDIQRRRPGIPSDTNNPATQATSVLDSTPERKHNQLPDSPRRLRQLQLPRNPLESRQFPRQESCHSRDSPAHRNTGNLTVKFPKRGFAFTQELPAPSVHPKVWMNCLPNASGLKPTNWQCLEQQASLVVS